MREGARSACGGEGVWERGAEGAERKGKECIIVYLCKKVSYGTNPPRRLGWHEPPLDGTNPPLPPLDSEGSGQKGGLTVFPGGTEFSPTVCTKRGGMFPRVAQLLQIGWKWIAGTKFDGAMMR